MYLIINEDGSYSKRKELTQADFESADDGYIAIIDISNPEDPKDYFEGIWESIDDYGIEDN